MQYVLTEKRDRIGTIILNRPEKRNALSYELVSELKSSFREAEGDNEIKVIVLKASGKAFCAGADLAYIEKLQSNTYQENLDDSNHLRELFEQIYNLPKPVISQVHGHAIAGGCGLATVCDFVFAVPEAKFGYTEVKIGFVPALVSVFLIRKVGEGVARELLLSGNLYSAEEMLSMNVINWVVPGDELEDMVTRFASQLVKGNSSNSMKQIKELFSKISDLSVGDALDVAEEINALSRETDDCRRGIDAFLKKKKISW